MCSTTRHGFLRHEVKDNYLDFFDLKDQVSNDNTHSLIPGFLVFGEHSSCVQ